MNRPQAMKATHNNDLRVSHPQEVVGLLGPRYPRVEERAARLHEALQEIFIREHAVSWIGLEQGKAACPPLVRVGPARDPVGIARIASR